VFITGGLGFVGANLLTGCCGKVATSYCSTGPVAPACLETSNGFARSHSIESLSRRLEAILPMRDNPVQFIHRGDCFREENSDAVRFRGSMRRDS
jgi:hypothetical protein